MSFALIKLKFFIIPTFSCEYVFEKNLPSDNRGFAKFVSHSELRHPQLNLLPGNNLVLVYIGMYMYNICVWLAGDTLTILCEISITGDSVVTSGTSKINSE